MTEVASLSPETLLSARYGAEQGHLPAAWNPLLESLLNHRSVRRYQSRPVDDALLSTLLAAAQSAANSSNLQCWSVVAVRDEGRKRQLASCCGEQAYVAEAPLFLVWLADLHRIEQVAQSKGAATEALDYLEMLLMATIDTALAGQNFAAAAESVGLGTVFIGGIRNRIDEVAALLQLPPKVTPLFGLCVGYPDEAAKDRIRPRLAQSAVLHRETYAAEGIATEVAAYDQAMARYQQAQGMAPEAWSDRSAARIRNGAVLHGRDRLREHLLKMGFALR